MSKFACEPTVPFLNGILKNVLHNVHTPIAFVYDVLSIVKNGEDSFYSYELTLSKVKPPLEVIPWVGEFAYDYESFKKSCSEQARNAVNDSELRTIFAHVYTGDICCLSCQYAKVVFEEVKKLGMKVTHSIDDNSPVLHEVEAVESVVLNLKVPRCLRMHFADGYIETYPKPTPACVEGLGVIKTFFADGSKGAFYPVLKKGDWFQHVVLELTLRPIRGGESFKFMVDPTYQFSLRPEAVPFLGGVRTVECARIVGRQLIGGYEMINPYMKRYSDEFECTLEQVGDPLKHYEHLYGPLFSLENMKSVGKQLVNQIGGKQFHRADAKVLDLMIKQGYCLAPKKSEGIYGNVITGFSEMDNNGNVRRKKKKSKNKKSKRNGNR